MRPPSQTPLLCGALSLLKTCLALRNLEEGLIKGKRGIALSGKHCCSSPICCSRPSWSLGCLFAFSIHLIYYNPEIAHQARVVSLGQLRLGAWLKANVLHLACITASKYLEPHSPEKSKRGGGNIGNCPVGEIVMGDS